MELEGFLQDLRTGALDSQGEFTLDEASSIRKMQPFANLNPALFLLKAVQLCVVLEARQVEIQLSSRRAVVRADDVHWTPVGTRHWVVLLNALRSTGRAFELRLNERRLSGRGQDIEGSACESGGFYLQTEPTGPLAALKQELSKRCFLCPIPVVVNHLNIVSGLPPGARAVQPGWLAECIHLCVDEPSFAIAPLACHPPSLLDGQPHQGRATFMAQLHLPTKIGPEVGFGPGFGQSARASLSLSGIGLGPILCAATIAMIPIKLLCSVVGTGAFFLSRAVAARVQQGLRQWDYRGGQEMVFASYSRACPPELLTPSQVPWDNILIPTWRTRIWIGLHPQDHDPGALHFVQDGILLDPGPRLPKGITAVVAAPVETDLGQLKVRLDPDTVKLCAKVEREAWNLLAHLGPRLEEASLGFDERYFKKLCAIARAEVDKTLHPNP